MRKRIKRAGCERKQDTKHLKISLIVQLSSKKLSQIDGGKKKFSGERNIGDAEDMT